jgi:hypothetical protein
MTSPARCAAVIAVAVAAIVATVTASAGAGAAAVSSASPDSHNPQVFVDPTGDSGSGPDIATVTIRNTAAGSIRFDIAIANAGPLLPDDSLIALFIDADRDASTGYQSFEYTIQTTGSTGAPALGHWDGTRMVAVDAPSLAQIWAGGGTMSFEISRTDLGGTGGFLAWAATGSTTGDEWDDIAPDGDATYDYTLSTPRVASAKARFAPATPRAGRRFAVTGVTFKLQTGERLPAARFRCRATLGGRALHGTGAGGCRFSLPRTSRGKRLALVVTATLGGETRTIRTTLRVR